MSINPLLPNARYWIKRIITDLESNWKKTTQKWPDPWAGIHGAIEQGDGKLIMGHNKEIEIHYSTWQSPATIPGETLTWGGLIIASVEHYFNLKKAIIELKGGGGEVT